MPRSEWRWEWAGLRRRTIALAGLLCGLAACALAEAAEGVTKGADVMRWALLIGVDQYQTLRKLDHSAAEQRALGNVLLSRGYKVFFCDHSGDQASLPLKANIDKKLDAIAAAAKRGDLLVVTFSGHGIERNGQNFLCPTDADPNRPETLISVKSVYDRLAQCEAGSKLLILDACREETQTAAGTTGFNPGAEAPPNNSNLEVWTSCSTGEFAYVDPEFKRGVFTHYLIEGLQGQADRNGNGRVTLFELLTYVSDETRMRMAGTWGKVQKPYRAGGTADFEMTEPRREQRKAVEENSLGMQLVLIPQGRFQMGTSELALAQTRAVFREQKLPAPPTAFLNEADDSGNTKSAEIPYDFYIGAAEVTVGQFRKFVTAKDNPWLHKSGAPKDWGFGLDPQSRRWRQAPEYSWEQPGFEQKDSQPVVNVSWDDADNFCKWLTNQERQEQREYRLPREVEWEYACRANSKTRYAKGDDPTQITRFANIADGTLKELRPDFPCVMERDGFPFTAPVGKLLPNDWGLYDMHGNVAEWCLDWYTDRYPREGEAQSGMYRVVRGGSWFSGPWDVRSAARDRCLPTSRSLTIGFRVVMIPK